ncbi:hypothetical protein IE81DRAFT_329351, partial [Ceraceosorus guamensis]
ELLGSHSHLISSSASHVIPAVSVLLGDTDAGVRRALAKLLFWYLPRLPSAVLSPHLSTLILYTTSALSNIYAQVRIDALSTLDLLIRIAPAHVCAGWQDAPAIRSLASTSTLTCTSPLQSASTSAGARVADCFCTLLGLHSHANAAAASTLAPPASMSTAQISTIASDLSSSAKIRLFQTLSAFIVAAESGERQTNHVEAEAHEEFGETEEDLVASFWPIASSFRTPAAYRAFLHSLALHSPSNAKRDDAVVDWSHNVASGSFGSSATQSTRLTDPLTTAPSSAAGHWNLQDLQGGMRDCIASGSATFQCHALAASTSTIGDARQVLFQALSPLLLSSFLEAAPAAFPAALPDSSPASRAENLDLVQGVIDLTRALWQGNGNAPSREDGTRSQAAHTLGALLQKWSKWWPFAGRPAEGAQSPSDSTIARLQALDTAFAELYALWMFAGVRPDQAQRKTKARMVRLSDVQAHVVEVLLRDARSNEGFDWDVFPQAPGTKAKEGASLQTVVPASAVEGAKSPRSLTAEEYTALLPSIWMLLNRRKDVDEGAANSEMAAMAASDMDNGVRAVFVALLEHWCAAKGPAKRAATKAICAFVLVKAGSKLIKGPYSRLDSKCQARAKGLLFALQPLDRGLREAAESVGAV